MRKNIILVVTLGVLALLIVLLNAKGKPRSLEPRGKVDVSGVWDFEVFGPAPQYKKAHFEATLLQNTNSLTGIYVPEVQLTEEIKSQRKSVRGKIKGNELDFIFLNETFPLLEFKGEVLGEKEMEGTYKMNIGNGFLSQPEREWRATRSR